VLDSLLIFRYCHPTESIKVIGSIKIIDSIKVIESIGSISSIMVIGFIDLEIEM